MKKEKKLYLRSFYLLPGEGSMTYAVLVFFSFIFAQVHRASFSHAVFIFVAVFPLLSVLCLLLSLPKIGTTVYYDGITVNRNGRATYALLIKNSGIIPVNAVLDLSVPKNNGERILRHTLRNVCIPHFSQIIVEAEMPFDRIGVFDIGAEEVFFYDFFKIIRVKKKADAKSTVRVTPDLLEPLKVLREGQTDDGGSARAAEDSSSYDYADVREYRAGDSIKRIHWKLSTKSEELQVKKYASDSENELFVICDIGYSASGSLTESTVCEIEDTALEEALSVIKDGADRKMAGIVSVKRPDETSIVFRFAKNGDISELAYDLAGVNTEPDNSSETDLSDVVKTVYVMPFISVDQAERVFEASKNIASGDFLVYLCDIGALLPEDRREKNREELENIMSVFEKNGIGTVCSGRREETV